MTETKRKLIEDIKLVYSAWNEINKCKNNIDEPDEIERKFAHFILGAMEELIIKVECVNNGEKLRPPFLKTKEAICAGADITCNCKDLWKTSSFKN